VVREGDWYVASPLVAATEAALLGALRHHHEARPLDAGMPAQAWRAAAAAPRAELVELAERGLERRGAIVRDGAAVRLPGWAPGGGTAARAATGALLSDIVAAGAEPPSVGELSASHPGVDVPAALRLLAQQGLVVAVGRDRYYAKEALEREREAVLGVLRELGEASPAAIRERLGRSRKWLIPLLEHLDREGVTVRRGDVRVLGRGPAS
jgi:selenocysteine-specific elongation factor